MQYPEIFPPHFTAAIFDMDGTMVNNMSQHQRAWEMFLKRYNMTLTDEEFHLKVSGRKNAQIFEEVFGETLSSKTVQAFADEKEAIYREVYAPDIREIDGLARIVEILRKRGLRIAVATTAPVKNREFVLDALGMKEKFEVIIGDEHVSHGKPNPEIYLSTARKLGVSPNQCIVFEDSPPGVEAGKNAGMVVVGVLSSQTPASLKLADYLINDYTELGMAG